MIAAIISEVMTVHTTCMHAPVDVFSPIRIEVDLENTGHEARVHPGWEASLSKELSEHKTSYIS